MATGVVGVIGVGGKTPNLLSVNRLSETSRETSSVSVGAWSVARAVRAYIADHCPDLDMRTLHVIDGRNAGGYNECRRKVAMTTHELSIKYSDDLLLSLKKSPQEFEAEARLLLAVKLYEMNRVSTGVAAQLAGMGRVAFMFELARFGLSPMGQDPEDLAEDMANA